MTHLKLKRAYEPQNPADGYRVYVDRLWPRGLSHETFHYDLWDKEISPSNELRQWFHENPEANSKQFITKYQNELLANPALEPLIDDMAKHPTVTLLYSSHDEQENNAVVLRNFIVKNFPAKFTI